jgi:hypothetical protein
LKQGIKKFGSKGVAAAHKELQQIHDRVVFEPIHLNEMTTLERKRAMGSLIFLKEKQDSETVKARMCANGSTQWAYISREEVTSPTAASEAIITTGVIDAIQGRDVCANKNCIGLGQNYHEDTRSTYWHTAGNLSRSVRQLLDKRRQAQDSLGKDA